MTDDAPDDDAPDGERSSDDAPDDPWHSGDWETPAVAEDGDDAEPPSTPPSEGDRRQPGTADRHDEGQPRRRDPGEPRRDDRPTGRTDSQRDPRRADSQRDPRRTVRDGERQPDGIDRPRNGRSRRRGAKRGRREADPGGRDPPPESPGDRRRRDRRPASERPPAGEDPPVQRPARERSPERRPPGEQPPARRPAGERPTTERPPDWRAPPERAPREHSSASGGGPDVGAYGPASGGRRQQGRRAPRDRRRSHRGAHHHYPSRPADAVERADPGPEPARTSTLLASALAVVAALGIAAAVGGLLEALVATAGAAGIAVGLVQVFEDDPVRVGGGVGLAFVAGVVALAGVLEGPPPVVAAVAVVAFGAVSAPLQAVGGGRLSAALGVSAYGLVPLGVVAIGGVVLEPLGFFAGEALDAVSAGGPELALPGFAVFVFVAVLVVRTALRTLPVAELTAKEDRDRTRERLADADRSLTAGLKASGVGIGLAVVLTVVLSRYAPGPLEALAVPFGSAGFRVPLALAAVGGALVVVGTWVTRWAGGTLLARPRRTAALAAGSFLAVAVVVAHGPILDRVRESLSTAQAEELADFVSSFGPEVTAALIAIGALTAVFAALMAVPASVGLRIAPERATAAVVAAAGLVGAAIIVAGDAPLLDGDGAGAPVVFAGIVAGLVVWDLGEYAVGVAEEVEDATAQRTELVHAAGSLGVGLVVLVGAVGVDALVRDAATGVSEPTALAGIATAAVGVILLLVVLRG